MATRDADMPKKVYWENDLEQAFVRPFDGPNAHHKRMPDQRGQYVMEMLSKWGMVAAEPDGEDSAGRSRLKLQDAQTLVRRACETIEAAFAEFDRRGWLIEFGDYDAAADLGKKTNS